MKRVVLNFVIVTALVALSACGGGDSDFNGTFIGTEQSSNGQPAARVTLTLSQNGQQISGVYTGQMFSGTITGVANSNTAQITVSPQQQGGQACQLTGTATQASQIINAQLQSSCQQGSIVQVTVQRQQQ